MEDCKKIVVVCGPTATGKTSLAIKIAQKFNGEIISADSMQVYKNLNIGTAKATIDEQKAVPHHLIDFLTPDTQYNVQIFTNLAKEKINDIYKINKLPIIAGGTGLYIESLINGIKFAQHENTSEVKNELLEILHSKGKDNLYAMLKEIDPEYAMSVHPNNSVRVLRALEVFKLTGNTMTHALSNSIAKVNPYNSLIIGLKYSDRQLLYNNINKRVDAMLQNGLLKEAELVYKNKDIFINSAAAIGYKEFFSYFDGNSTLEAAIEQLKQASRNYAKRQLTWFNRMTNINWIDIDKDDDYINHAYTIVKEFLYEQ